MISWILDVFFSSSSSPVDERNASSPSLYKLLHHQLRQKMQVQDHGINIGNLHPSTLPPSILVDGCLSPLFHGKATRSIQWQNVFSFIQCHRQELMSSSGEKNCEKLGEFCRKCRVSQFRYFLVQFFFSVRTWGRHQVDIDIFGQHHNSNPNQSLHSKFPTSNQPNLKKICHFHPFPHLDPKVLGSKTSGISGTCVCGTWFASPRPQMLVDTTGMPRSCASVTIKPKASG